MTQHPPNMDLISQLIAEARETLRQRRAANEDQAEDGAVEPAQTQEDAASGRAGLQRH